MEGFFSNYLVQCVFEILLSSAFGIILGIERKNHLQAIGIRTLLLISVSCALLGNLSYFAAQVNMKILGDPTRIAAGVVTGIGFIGGGAILHQGFNIKGVTTATIIWTTAALGLAVGFGLYVPALFAFALILVGLPIFAKVEEKFFPAAKVKTLSLVYQGDEADINKIADVLFESGIIQRDINFSNSFSDDKIKISILVNAPDSVDFTDLGRKLKKAGKLVKFSFE